VIKTHQNKIHYKAVYTEFTVYTCIELVTIDQISRNNYVM